MIPEQPRERWAGAMWLGVLAGLLAVALAVVLAVGIAALVRLGLSGREHQPVAAVCPKVTAGLKADWGLAVVEDRTVADGHQSMASCVLQDRRGVTTLTVVVRRFPETYRSAHEEAAAEVAFQCLSAERDYGEQCIDDLGPPIQPYGQSRTAVIDDGETVVTVTMTGPPRAQQALAAQVARTFGGFQTDEA